jgi:hypothetical protein
MADKLAWFHFYPGDWMKDPNLRRCSPAARGVLMDILCLMFECEERGRLSTAGIPWTDAEIAGAVNGESFASLESLKELESKCVLKRDEKGCLFSERLIRDEEIRQIRAKSGRKGGKASVKQKRSKPSSKTQANTQAPSDSDSVSDSSPEIPEGIDSATVREAVAEWSAYRRESRKPWSKRSASMCFRQWQSAGWSQARIVAAIRHSIANGYQGIYEPSANGKPQPPPQLSARERQARFIPDD